MSYQENGRGGSYTTGVYEEAAGRGHKEEMPSIYGLLVCYCEHIWNNTPLHLTVRPPLPIYCDLTMSSFEALF
jgi:hypothetical protein